MKRASLTATSLFTLVFVGCATGGQDENAPRTDASHLDDASLSDAPVDAPTADSSIAESSTDDSSTAETSTSDAPATDIGTDTTIEDTTVPDTAAPDSTAPDSTAPDSTAPDTTVLDTTAPDTSSPDTTTPDTTAPDTASPDTAETAVCPTPITLGTFDSGAESWTFDGLWRYDGGSASMVAGSTTKYSSSYTQNLTSPTNLDLSSCASATLSFSVRLADDPDYASKGPDKSERLYVQCSGDGGGTWTNLTPSPWPTNQSACATSYCCGGPGSTRSFPLTAQSIVLPAACRTATTRLRFQAKGSSVWNLQNPGWYVDNVRVN
jgi:hypothetical protein